MPTRAQIENAIHNHFDAWNAGDRARCGAVAPADGLFLMRVDY